MLKYVLILGLWVLILCQTVCAQILTPDQQEELRRQQEQIQREQQRLFDEELRRRELEDAFKRPIDMQPETTVPEIDLSGNCVEINTIEYTGNTKISNKKIDKAIRDFTGRCINIDEINAMLQIITNIYIDKGYVTSRAYMTMPQDRISEGILEIKILEGRVSTLEGLKRSEKFMAFPQSEDKILYLRHIEQGLDQINRLPSNSAKMDIKPDEEREGYSRVIIANSPVDKTRIGVTVDNAGSFSTGEWRTGIRLAHDNLFRLNDQLNFSYYKPIYHDYDEKNSDSLLASFSIPFRYWTVSNNLSYSSNKSSLPLPVSRTNLYTLGETTNNSFSVSRLITRGQKHKISLGAGLAYKHTNSYTEVYDFTTKNEGASRTLTVFNVEAPVTLYFNSGMAYIKPSFHRGLRLFGALKDCDSPYSQKAQYEAYKLYAYYAKRMWKGTLNVTVDGQFSRDELFSSESFYIGGEYSIRGFKNDGAQGDSGISVKTDYSLNLGQLTGKTFLLPYSASVFFDYGYVESCNSLYTSYNLSGAGGKLSVYYKYFETSVTYAAVLHKTDDIQDNAAVYFSAEFKYAF